ncbi:hypothetical protein RPMA_08475 [Tardiphaga alba]|uniref:Secreted protein n=1 Tax=Tardiphaga alba TaxID=340268 RepID=A0ABX8A590_9BRAD|nr:hypothetical protein [Tardiphaga alba]QUS38859.1 hypothetical protein RPMA_08475 [Tardiphaga alba]
MMTKLTFAVVITVLSTMPSAQAQQLQARECNASNIAFVAEAIAKMPEGKQKKTASDEISAASEKLATGQTDECKDHLLKASLQTK